MEFTYPHGGNYYVRTFLDTNQDVFLFRFSNSCSSDVSSVAFSPRAGLKLLRTIHGDRPGSIVAVIVGGGTNGNVKLLASRSSGRSTILDVRVGTPIT
jgi:hypothetical protein